LADPDGGGIFWAQQGSGFSTIIQTIQNYGDWAWNNTAALVAWLWHSKPPQKYASY